MAKARMLVRGNVQGVGYRVLVKLYAVRMGVKGLVRNLSDGSVEVFADGPEQAVEELSKSISLKGRPEDPLSPHVENLEVHWEGAEGYRPAWRSYEGFEIDYGVEELRRSEREMLDSLEWSKLHFTRMGGIFREELEGVKSGIGEVKDGLGEVRSELVEVRSELVGVKSELRGVKNGLGEVKDELVGVRGELGKTRVDIKSMHEDLRNGINGVRSEVKDMHADINKSFEEMAKRYDAISAELVRTREELTRAVNGLLKLIEEFIQQRHGTSG